MLKRVAIGLGILAWLACFLGFYLQLGASELSKSTQVGILTAWIAAGIIALVYLLGLQVGYRKASGSLQKLGILRAFKRATADKDSPFSKLIQNATSDIFLTGVSLPLFDGFTGVLMDKASDGIQVRLLVPDPCEEWLILAIGRLMRQEKSYPRELSCSFNNFLFIWRKVPNAFHVRVHKQIPTISASMFDGKQGNIQLYMYGWRTDDRLILELDFGGSAKDWKTNLDLIWHEATSLSSEEMFHERIEAADRITQKLKERTQGSES